MVLIEWDEIPYIVNWFESANRYEHMDSKDREIYNKLKGEIKDGK